MPPIFAQVHDEAIASGEFDEDCCGQGIWIGPAPGLAKRCDMVDIDAQPGHGTSSLWETDRKGMRDGK
ncbi:MAG: hypothetical protein LZF86_10206 [Nitrospira sp.]|nr:MAG: hypothetical protein LZF86_10206 [Nitrospira sp.]